MATKKIMIIIWRWKGLIKVNKNYIEKPKNQSLLNNIKQNHPRIYDVWNVEPSQNTKIAKVIRASIINTEETQPLLKQLIDLEATDDCKIFLFLHRNNFYTQKDVKTLLQKYPLLDKCFLFGDGRDFIYYKTKNEGLLDGAGKFKIGIVFPSEQIIKQPHFDNVWQYYSLEFKQKLQDLNEAIQAYCMGLTTPSYGEFITKQTFINFLKQKPTLYYRIKSFLNIYPSRKEINQYLFKKEGGEDILNSFNSMDSLFEHDFNDVDHEPIGDYINHNGLNEMIEQDEDLFNKYNQYDKELNQLILYEEEQQTSFVFDDLHGNLIQDTKLYKLYQQIVSQLKPILIEEESDLSKQIPIKSFLIDLHNKLERLYENMPGPT